MGVYFSDPTKSFSYYCLWFAQSGLSAARFSSWHSLALPCGAWWAPAAYSRFSIYSDLVTQSCCEVSTDWWWFELAHRSCHSIHAASRCRGLHKGWLEERDHDDLRSYRVWTNYCSLCVSSGPRPQAVPAKCCSRLFERVSSSYQDLDTCQIHHEYYDLNRQFLSSTLLQQWLISHPNPQYLCRPPWADHQVSKPNYFS